MDRRTIEISWLTLWRIFVFLIVVWVIFMGRQIFLGLFLAVIISSGLEGLVNLMERISLPRTVSVILIFLAALLGIILLIYTVVPLLIVELNNALSNVGQTNLGGFSVLFNLKASQSASSLVSKISSSFFSNSTSPLDVFSNALGSFGLAVAVIVSSFYLTIGHDGVEQFLEIIVPPDYEESVMRIYGRVRKRIGSWFRMQILLSLIMGFTVWGGLTLLGVKYAFLIGIIAGVFELVPFVGPILAGAVGVIMALLTSTTLAFWTLIFFIIAQQLESNVFVPLLSRHTVGLHPVIVIGALLIGATVGGVLGIIISVPAAAVFQEVVYEFSVKKRPSLEEAA
ncbi:MAG TPA: AI-2E family transporter [Candidatus Paceibacterota bacterium]|nr:AI-2E family transporter [Candidatus Paceibacterota bacterium]